MYEIEDFLKPYYEELEPKKRLEILNTLAESFDDFCHDSSSDNSSADLEFLRGLYQDRYSDHENKGRKDIDWWLWRCLCLQILYNNKENYFFYQRKYQNREVMVILTEFHMNDTEEAHKKFFYHEYRNLARRYLSTCRDSGYASGFFGLKKATDQEKIFRACNDIWQMSEGIARKEGIINTNTTATTVNADNKAVTAVEAVEDAKATDNADKSENQASSLTPLWCKAFYDELMCFDASCFEEYENLRKKFLRYL